MVQARALVPPMPPGFVGSSEDWEALHEDWLDQEWESNEPPLESDLHREQISLLIRLLKYFWRDRHDFYASGYTTVFYDPQKRVTLNFRGTDFYVVLGAEKRDRKSWMLWKEQGKYPNVVIELLSDSTAKVDRTTKKTLYQDTWRVMDYFLFHPFTQELQGFSLVGGFYQDIQPNVAGQLWSAQLGLWIGLHQDKLRFFTASGELVLLEEEAEADRATVAEERATVAEERAIAAEARAIAAERQATQEGLEKGNVKCFVSAVK